MDKNEELKKYIYSQIQSGINPDEIKKQLTASGWDAQSIDAGFAGVQSQITPNAAPAPTITTTPATATTATATATTATTPATATAAAPAMFEANGQKRGKLKTSWLLFKQSMKVLKNNKQLVRYPLMGFVLSMAVTIVFGILFFVLRDTLIISSTDYNGDSELNLSIAGYAVAIVYYVINYFFIFMYNAGLAAHVLDIFKGKSDSYSHYMSMAWSKKVQIFVYAVITTTVGLILSAIERRFKVLGPYLRSILGTVWAFANLFTIPIIVETNKSTPEAIKESGKLFVSRWGENIGARVTFGLIAFLMYLIIFIPVSILLILLLSVLGAAGVFLFIGILIVSVFVLSIIINTASSVLSTGLYYYARYNIIPAAYEASLLNSVFIAKTEKQAKAK